MQSLVSRVRIAVCATALLASGAQAVLIDFDKTPYGAAIPDSVDISLTYASVGVTFAFEGNGCGPAVYANDDRPQDFGSPPNVVSTCGGGSASDIDGIHQGLIRVDFNRPVTRVCIDVRPDDPGNNAILRVYDADFVLIAQAESVRGVTGPLCVEAAGIRHARLPGNVQGIEDDEYARFDNLSVTFADTTPNYGGLWWRAPETTEAGWGLNLAHQGDVIFATWFTYGLDGKPWWLAAVLQRTGPGTYQGDLFVTTGPAFDAVPFDPASVTETTIGTATLTFADNDHATFQYTVNAAPALKAAVTQTKNVTRQVYATPVPFCVWNSPTALELAANYQDLWWNFPGGSESGWGINFTHQGDTIFATWFTYDHAGKPWWLAFVAVKNESGDYEGDIFTTTGPPFSAEPFDPAIVVETTIGHATLTFSDGNKATFVYTVNGVSQTKTVTRQVFGPPGTLCR